LIQSSRVALIFAFEAVCGDFLIPSNAIAKASNQAHRH
jgi:hypothetical protein